MKYRKGYKYQLAENYIRKTSIIGYKIDTEFIRLTPIGMLFIKSGYAWDGASGPTIDTKSSMEGSLVHDALYQLMREGLLPGSERKIVDALFRSVCVENGMSKIRASLWEKAVQLFAASAASKAGKRKVYVV